jgi:hypothetical protein
LGSLIISLIGNSVMAWALASAAVNPSTTANAPTIF